VVSARADIVNCLDSQRGRSAEWQDRYSWIYVLAVLGNNEVRLLKLYLTALSLGLAAGAIGHQIDRANASSKVQESKVGQAFLPVPRTGQTHRSFTPEQEGTDKNVCPTNK
jgi:hypothetical protein